MVEELKDHSEEICSKAGIAQQLLDEALDRTFETIELASLPSYQNELPEALLFVRDESDAPFAALALARSPSTIVTYNKKHFNFARLSRRHVQVLTPVEALRKLR